ncbi:MAG: hypothetical protein QOD99_2131 [Chthoniobacter sp.]|jgi:hypothetical protein|nr:hypothetical protein [Chthoniobacter sp.]
MNASAAWHVDLDGAWPRDVPGTVPYFDARDWGPRLRYSATRALVRDFYEKMRGHLAPFTLYGSGDFHYLTALWLQRLADPFTLVSFDNHPDWDVRPPRWCCGTWINRALELPNLHAAVIWGCGNFELNWPSRLFANHRALHADRLRVWPWAERIAPSARKLWPGMRRDNWRDHFSQFASSLSGRRIYVTVDLDCLSAEDAVTNWENGLFTSDDIAWALSRLRARAEIVGGDVCGAFSPVVYARFKQRIEGTIDHPRIAEIDAAEAARRNLRALETIWPALTGGNQHHPGADQQDADPQAATHFLP